jgi:Flp pilus assembly protein TadG
MDWLGGILGWDENAMVLIGSASRSRFFRKEDGSATLESVLWLPVFIAFLTLAADASFIFFGQNQAYRIVQNANRSLSVGRLLSEDEVVDYLSAELSNLAPNAQVTASIEDGTITSIARIPASDLTATRMFTAFLDVNITVGARQFVEY